MYMKLGEAQQLYRNQRQALINQRKLLIQRRDDLKKKSVTESDKQRYSEEAATLELSIREVNKQFDENQEVLDGLIEQHAAIWNAEVARQQGDAMQEAAVDLAKIMEVARRISRGAIVPLKDEQKVMDYSMELYLASKNMAVMNAQKKKEEYDSLWEDEGKPKEEYDPQGKADNTTVNIDIPELFTPESSGEISGE